MTQEQKKEAISNSFIGTIASFRGFKFTKAPDTGGVDYSVSRDIILTNADGTTRHLQDGNYIDIQMKSTTTVGVVEEPNFMKYHLEAKSYNDLIYRRNLGAAPLILILFVLPQNEDEWLTITDAELAIRHSAYWFIPPDNADLTTNKYSKTIRVAKANRFDLDTWPRLYTHYFEK